VLCAPVLLCSVLCALCSCAPVLCAAPGVGGVSRARSPAKADRSAEQGGPPGPRSHHTQRGGVRARGAAAGSSERRRDAGVPFPSGAAASRAAASGGGGGSGAPPRPAVSGAMSGEEDRRALLHPMPSLSSVVRYAQARASTSPSRQRAARTLSPPVRAACLSLFLSQCSWCPVYLVRTGMSYVDG
jgi:hypothetical protein